MFGNEIYAGGGNLFNISFNIGLGLYDIARLILIFYCLNIRDNNRYNFYIQFSIQYQDCGVKNVKNLVLS